MVKLDDNTVTITAQRAVYDHKDHPGAMIFRPSGFEAFQKSYTLPSTPLEETLEAKFENGRLHVSVQKEAATHLN